MGKNHFWVISQRGRYTTDAYAYWPEQRMSTLMEPDITKPGARGGQGTWLEGFGRYDIPAALTDNIHFDHEGPQMPMGQELTLTCNPNAPGIEPDGDFPNS